MFEFNIKLDEDDYLELNLYHMLNNSIVRKLLIISRFIIPIIFFILLVKTYIEGTYFQIIIIEGILFTIISILWICFSNKVLLKSLKKKSEKEYKKIKEKWSTSILQRINIEVR